MLGNEDNPGIMPLTLQELFNKIEEYSSEREYKVKLWYIEIYNENIRDLLSNTDEYLDLREDPNKGISIANISELNVTSCKDIMQILKKGNKNRTQEATNANETSSRSHAILQVVVEYKDKATGLEAELKLGKLSLIDLAGSERASATQNRGIRLIEGANINRSLLTLGNCINALCEASEKGTKPYVPYRDSKLTRLLKDSLGGNSRTVMIANVSPSVSTFDDTYNTLKYANRAKNIKTHIQRNVLSVQYHISNYNNIINNLKNEIFELKQQLAKNNNNGANPSNPANMNSNMNTINPPTNKHSSDTNVTIWKKDDLNFNNNPSSLFEKCVQELKSHCEDETVIKNKIIDQEQEINNLLAIIKNYQNSNKEKDNNVSMPNNSADAGYNNSNNNTIEKDEPMKTEGNSVREDITAIDDKDIIILNNNNLSNNNENNSTSARLKSSNIKEKEVKLVGLKRLYDINLNKFKELQTKREAMMNNFYKMGIKEFHFEYLQSILKAHVLKLSLVENKFKEKFSVALASIKESYIAELENQVKLRDAIIRRQGLNLNAFEHEESSRGKIKSIEQLKSEYSNKLPIIPRNNREIKEVHGNYGLNNMNIISGINNLPPISGKDNSSNNIEKIQKDIFNTPHHNNSNNQITNNINAILSDLKIVNSNLNKIEMNQAHNLKRDKSKLRNDFSGMNNKEIAKEKFNQARNYSQGIRNLNGLKDNNYSNNCNIPPSNNIYTLNQRVQLAKNGSAKQIKLNSNNGGNIKSLYNNNIYEKKLIKDSNSEKSINYSNNISQDQEANQENSDVIELVNNNSDEENINMNAKPARKRNNHFKEQRKSALTKDQVGSKEESPSYYVSPIKRDNVNGNYFSNKNRREDSVNRFGNDYIPQFKKRDLNVYQLGKLKNQKKMPFKI